jgi:hypothetical protein
MIKLLRENVSFVMTVVIVAGLWLALRTTATEFGPDSSFDKVLAQGEPVVVEFFGNT